jgi:hypothetical protein
VNVCTIVISATVNDSEALADVKYPPEDDTTVGDNV